jgi:predicted RNA-binding Zn ribbon-like protein
LALDLVNTWDPYLADPERLPDPGALRRFLAEHQLGGAAGDGDLERVRALRRRLQDILTTADGEELVSRLNEFLAENVDGAALVQRDGGRWAVAPRPRAPGSLDARLAGIAATELAELVAAVGASRIRSCRAAPCVEVFVDTSRNARRRYCSRRCANRVNATRHRRTSRSGSTHLRSSSSRGRR